jgi:hypothetical protein
MKGLKRLWALALSSVLLMSIVVGIAAAGPNSRPLEQSWRVLAVPPHACIPRDKAENWTASASFIHCNSATCGFHCPLDFPAAGEQTVGAVNVKRFTMYAYDNGLREITAVVRKTYPPTGGWEDMASVSSADSPADPQGVMDTSIDANPMVYRSQTPYIDLTIGNNSFKVYGFYVHYTW